MARLTHLRNRVHQPFYDTLVELMKGETLDLLLARLYGESEAQRILEDPEALGLARAMLCLGGYTWREKE